MTNSGSQGGGGESPGQIGPYLRRFVSAHHDTLAVAVKRWEGCFRSLERKQPNAAGNQLPKQYKWT